MGPQRSQQGHLPFPCQQSSHQLGLTVFEALSLTVTLRGKNYPELLYGRGQTEDRGEVTSCWEENEREMGQALLFPSL